MMQPYAWLFARGLLRIDDRAWSTAYRGPLAIHASQQFAQQYYDFLRECTPLALPPVSDFERGGFVGVAELVACLARQEVDPADPAAHVDARRSHFGMPGYFGFVLENPRPIALLPARGRPGLFPVTADAADALLKPDAGHWRA